MKRTVSLFLVLALCLGLLSGCAGETKTEAQRQEYTNPSIFSLDLPKDGAGVSFGTPEEKPAEQPDQTVPQPEEPSGQSAQTPAQTTANSAPVQLTMEDIQKMNGDDVVIDIYNNSGYISTLVGKFYEGKVNNAEDGVESLTGIASLLGLTKGCKFFAVYFEKDDDGYTYYTYQQRYSTYTLQYATLRLVVDPDGYVAGVTSSFFPNVGTGSDEEFISKEQAESIIRQQYSGIQIQSGRTVKLACSFNSVIYNCWIVYTNNPNQSASFDMPYVAHYIASDGSYLAAIPCNSFAVENKEVMDNSGYFEDLTVKDVSFTLKMPTGGTKQITVPVSKNKNDGKYYLMDPNRSIAVGKFKEFFYQDEISFVSNSAQDSGWSENDLMAYYNYINAYDFYAERGIRSVDGFGVPILILSGYCDQQGNPVDNACFCGVMAGWACFAASDANKYSYCADVCGHEFTHGVTSTSMQGIFYQNETGAINEAYSDIMGNICEKLTGQTTDTGWLVAENSGNGQMRDMADPNSCNQPAYVGDRYYVPAVFAPSEYSDQGGVHIDNTLVSHLAYLLDEAGMSLDEQFSMWSTSIELLTPKSDYEDLHGILLLSLKINGMLDKYGRTVNNAFADAGLNEDWNVSYLEATKAGCGRVTFQVDGSIASLPCIAAFYGADGSYADGGYPDRNGTVSVLLPAGYYALAVQYQPEGQSQGTVLYYSESGWSSNTNNLSWFQVTDGGKLTLNALGGTGGSGTTTPTPTPTPTPAPDGDEGGELNLIQFNGGYFSLLMPEGWRIEVNGEYGAFSFKLFDPMNPSMQVFFYGALAPFHKSEQSRRYLSYYDTTGGLIANGPVLTSPTVRGITDCWQYCIEYQKRYDKQLFTDLSDINMLLVTSYDGPYAGYGQETVGLGSCYDAWGNQCVLAMASSLIDMDFYGYYGGNWYYTAFGTMGVLCPIDQFDAYYVDLLTCGMSLQFSEDYIRASQYSSVPLDDNDTIADSLYTIAEAIYELCDELE